MSDDDRNLKNNPRPKDSRGFGPGGGHFGRPVEKAKDFKGSLKRLVRYLKPHRVNLIIVLIFAVLSTTFTIAAPKITAKAMNKLQDSYMAKMMLNSLAEAQIKIHEEIVKHLEQIEKDSNALDSQELQNQQPLNPELRKNMEEISKLPLLSEVKDADEKAEIARKMVDLVGKNARRK